MGLLDILNGMQNDPGGQREPTAGKSSGGMSPIMMALLGLLAYKALKGSGGLGNVLGGSSPTGPASHPGGAADAGKAGGGLGDLLGGLLGGGRGGSSPNASLPGGLGGLLGGPAAGSVLSGGLSKLIRDFQNSGQGKAAQSWVGSGPNQEIAPESLEAAIGADTLDALAQQTGMNRNHLLAELGHRLPGFIDQLTPSGRLPTAEEASRMV